MILHAQKEFLLNFGLNEELLPVPLSRLLGNSTERAKIARLQQCMMTGRSFSEFMNLHKSNGGSLSCYVSLLCLTKHKPASQISTPRQQAECSEELLKYGILTVRSASVVGNSKYSGIGLMGTERVPRERVQDMPNAGSQTKQMIAQSSNAKRRKGLEERDR